MGTAGEGPVEHVGLVTVGRYFSPAEAHAGRMALEAAGLAAWVFDESLGGVYGVGVGTRLQVRVEDEGAARAILGGEVVGSEALPPDIAEPPCPQCGSRQVRPVSEPIDDPERARDQRGSRNRDWYYVCGSCGHRWLQEDE